MQEYRTTVEFYTVPLLKGGGKPFVTTPETSVTQRFEGADIPGLFPEEAYAFRPVVVETRIFNKGLKSDEWSYDMPFKALPLIFIGGKHVDVTQLETVFGKDSTAIEALKGYGNEFVVTRDDVIVPFDPSQDMVLELVDGVWEQCYPVPSPEPHLE